MDHNWVPRNKLKSVPAASLFSYYQLSGFVFVFLSSHSGINVQWNPDITIFDITIFPIQRLTFFIQANVTDLTI